MARTRAALALVAVAAVAVVLVSGGSSADPRTPPALPGMPPPFLTVAVVGDGGLTAGIDAYGDVVDLRAGPAGAALIDNPSERQAAGTVPADTGIVPLASIGNGPPQPLWRAESVRQSYLPGTNVLRTVARFGGALVRIECTAGGGELGCVSGATADGRRQGIDVSFRRNLVGGGRRIHLDDKRARRILAAAAAADRRWLARARPLGSGAPAWARAIYGRSLLAMRALAGRDGAVAAGARDGWAYVWPRDAGRLRSRSQPRAIGARPVASSASCSASTSAPRRASTATAIRSWTAPRRVTLPAGSKRPPGRPTLPHSSRPSIGETVPTTKRNPPATTSATPSPMGRKHAYMA